MATNPPPNLPIAKDVEPSTTLKLPPAPLLPPKPVTSFTAPVLSTPKPPSTNTLPQFTPSVTAKSSYPPPVTPKPETASRAVGSNNINTKSSIRTMEGDIKSVSKGTPAKGVEVTIPNSPPLPSIERPATQTPQKTLPPSANVSIAGAEKRSVIPSNRPYSPQQVKDKPAPSTEIAVPPKKTPVFNRWTLIAVIVLVALGSGGYWFYFLREGETPPISSSSPSPTFKPDFLKPLKLIFTDNDSVIIPDLASMADFEPLNLALSQVVISEGSKNLFLEPKNEAEEPMSFSSFASKFLTNPNQSLLGNITDKRFGLVISRQQEKFDSLGEPVLEAESETRTALIVEVTDVTIAKTAMSEWEQTLPEALLDFFQITDESDQIAFDDNSYRDVSIRFMNFPSPDRSIDYAFVSSATGNTYLVVANSREQIYSIIDTLLGF